MQEHPGVAVSKMVINQSTVLSLLWRPKAQRCLESEIGAGSATGGRSDLGISDLGIS